MSGPAGIGTPVTPVVLVSSQGKAFRGIVQTTFFFHARTCWSFQCLSLSVCSSVPRYLVVSSLFSHFFCSSLSFFPLAFIQFVTCLPAYSPEQTQTVACLVYVLVASVGVIYQKRNNYSHMFLYVHRSHHSTKQHWLNAGKVWRPRPVFSVFDGHTKLEYAPHWTISTRYYSLDLMNSSKSPSWSLILRLGRVNPTLLRHGGGADNSTCTLHTHFSGPTIGPHTAYETCSQTHKTKVRERNTARATRSIHPHACICTPSVELLKLAVCIEMYRCKHGMRRCESPTMNSSWQIAHVRFSGLCWPRVSKAIIGSSSISCWPSGAFSWWKKQNNMQTHTHHRRPGVATKQLNTFHY